MTSAAAEAGVGGTTTAAASELIERFGLPGAVSVSRVRVYDWEAHDGLRGGSPHFHTVSREGYVVVGGAGSVQTLTAAGLSETPLEPNRLVWFSPGTVHRLVNRGGLEIVALMQNAGLPEVGDAVLTFPLEHLENVRTYAAAHSLPADPARQAEAARARRDLALQGFAQLVTAVDERGPQALTEYYERAAAIVASRLDRWRGVWRRGPAAESLETERRLDALAAGDVSHLQAASVRRSDAGPVEVWGMCGRLTVWPDVSG